MAPQANEKAMVAKGYTPSQKEQLPMDNLYDLPDEATADDGREFFETLLTGSQNILVERIISQGQTTPEGAWYDQVRDEWVVILEGSAQITYGDGQEINLFKGDQLFLPKQAKHRVTYTSTPCIWLAIHGENLCWNDPNQIPPPASINPPRDASSAPSQLKSQK